jgi:hypothetical protein
MQYFRSKFGKNLYVMSGLRPGSTVAGSGNTSNHASGDAVDISTPTIAGATQANPPPRTNVDALHSFIARHLPAPPRLDFLWRTMQGGNHFNHIHLGLSPAVTQTVAAARAWIAKNFPEGDVFGGAGVKLRKIAGTEGPMKNIAKALIEKITKAANRFIDSRMDASMGDFGGPGPDSVPLGPGGAGQKIFNYFKDRGFTDNQAAAWVGNFFQESGLDPGAIQSGGPGRGLAQWGGGRFTALQNFAAQRGTPWQNMQTQLDFVWHELQGTEGSAFRSIKAARSLQQAVDAIGQDYERFGISGDRYGPAMTALEQYSRDADHGPKRRAMGGFVGSYAKGGELPGRDGQPVPIIAHAGEWVLNKMQQSKLASIMGTSANQLKKMLGFGLEGKSHFADGGEVNPEVRRLQGIKRGNYEFPLINPTDLDDISREVSRVYRAISNISRKGKAGKSLDRFIKNIRAMTDDDGWLDQMGVAIENLGTKIERSASLAAVGLRRVGRRLVGAKPLEDAVQIADNAIKGFNEIGKALAEQRRESIRGLRKINAQIARIERGGVSKNEQDDYTTLLAARQKFRDTLDSNDDAVAENYAARFEARQDKFNAQTEAALRDSEGRSKTAEIASRIAALIGDSGGVARAGEAQLAALRDQQVVLERRATEAAQKAARDPRWREIADELAERVQDGAAAIQEQIAANFTAAVDAANKQFEQGQRVTGIFGRLIDVRERAGDRLGAARNRISLSEGREGILGDQRARLDALRQRAVAEGNIGAVSDLTDQINDLTVQMVEEQQTRKELIATYRATATAIITGQSGAATGFIGAAQNIASILGNISGVAADLLPFLKQTATVLAGAAKSLADNVREAIKGNEFGGTGSNLLRQLVAAFQQGPKAFAETLSALGPALAAAAAGMGDEQAAAFNALINSMIDNTTAVADNTLAIQEANPESDAQSFASTAWTQFRTAIFSGAGGLLPQYASSVPNMSSPASSFSPSSPVTPFTRSAGGEQYHLNVTSPTEVLDPNDVGRQLAFARNTGTFTRTTGKP